MGDRKFGTEKHMTREKEWEGDKGTMMEERGNECGNVGRKEHEDEMQEEECDNKTREEKHQDECGEDKMKEKGRMTRTSIGGKNTGKWRYLLCSLCAVFMHGFDTSTFFGWMVLAQF